MPALYGAAGGVNRKLRELHGRDQSAANRKLKEMWARDSGAVGRKIFSAGAQAGETTLWCDTMYGTDNAWILSSDGQLVDQQPSGLTVHEKATCWLNDSSSSDAAYFGFTIPLNFGEPVPFYPGTSSSSEPICLRVAKSFNVNFLNDEPDDNYVFKMPNMNIGLDIRQEHADESGADSYLLNPVSTGDDYVKTFQAGDSAKLNLYGNSFEAQSAYLKVYAHLQSDNGNLDDVLYCKFNILIPDGALVIVGGNGKEYPISF